jgi:Tol biopolymer transport system component
VGSTQTTLPFASASSLAWSPDGTRLVVTARNRRTAPADVYTVDADGTDLVRPTTNYNSSSASW